MLPGVSAGHPLLLINGLNTQATQMATQYLTSENTVRTLVQRLHQAQPDHRGPWYFQLVLKTEVYDKVPTRAIFVALRVL
jgi:hypothetical protein